MKITYNINYIINSLVVLLLFCASAQAQNDSIIYIKTDTTKLQDKYGLRIGVELSKIARSIFDDDYTGLEIDADFRLTKKWYLAGAIGNEEYTNFNDYLNASTQGTYFKVGVDYNAYQNWYGMNNMFYGGFRIGVSSFSQTLNSYSVYSQTQYWTPQYSSDESIKFSGLSAIWGEFIIGIKVEVLTNLFLGLNTQFRYMISQEEPENFENLYIPGFQKTYDNSNFGFGYGYTISYLIPFYKKDK